MATSHTRMVRSAEPVARRVSRPGCTPRHESAPRAHSRRDAPDRWPHSTRGSDGRCRYSRQSHSPMGLGTIHTLADGQSRVSARIGTINRTHPTGCSSAATPSFAVFLRHSSRAHQGRADVLELQGTHGFRDVRAVPLPPLPLGRPIRLPPRRTASSAARSAFRRARSPRPPVCRSGLATMPELIVPARSRTAMTASAAARLLLCRDQGRAPARAAKGSKGGGSAGPR